MSTLQYVEITGNLSLKQRAELSALLPASLVQEIKGDCSPKISAVAVRSQHKTIICRIDRLHLTLSIREEAVEEMQDAVEVDHIAVVMPEGAAQNFSDNLVTLGFKERETLAKTGSKNSKKPVLHIEEFCWNGEFSVFVVHATQACEALRQFCAHNGPSGIQHIALSVADAAQASVAASGRGVRFQTEIVSHGGVHQIFTTPIVGEAFIELIRRPPGATIARLNTERLLEMQLDFIGAQASLQQGF